MKADVNFYKWMGLWLLGVLLIGLVVYAATLADRVVLIVWAVIGTVMTPVMFFAGHYIATLEYRGRMRGMDEVLTKFVGEQKFVKEPPKPSPQAQAPMQIPARNFMVVHDEDGTKTLEV